MEEIKITFLKHDTFCRQSEQFIPTSHVNSIYIFLLLVASLHKGVPTVNSFISRVLIRENMRWKRADQKDADAEGEDRIKIGNATGICVGGCCYHSRLNSASIPDPAIIRPAILFTHCNS